MKQKINDVYNLVEDWNVVELERLLSELEDLYNTKWEVEEKTLNEEFQKKRVKEAGGVEEPLDRIKRKEKFNAN
jgi:hypothetical protein